MCTKRPDRARLATENNKPVDEIKQHLNAHYVCAPEAVHRTSGYELQDKSHTVYRLAVHLPNLQPVPFVEGAEEAVFENL